MNIDVNSLYNRKRVNRWERVSVGDMLERVTYSFPDKEAIVSYEGAYADEAYARLTYKEGDDLANQFANGLLAKGFERGDRVLFFCDNSAEAFIAKLGVAKAGLVVVPVNTMVASDVLAYIMDLTEPVFTVVDAEHWERIQPVFIEKNLSLDITIPINGTVIPGSLSYTDFVGAQEVTPPEVEIHGDDIWEILFTSGTTSMPKGAMISHHNTYFAAYNYGMKLSRGLHFEGDYIVGSFLPNIYHVGDQTLPGSAFLMGGTFLLGRKHELVTVAEAITKEKMTALWAGSSEALKELVDTYEAHPNAYNFQSVTSIIYGYTSLDPIYHDKLKAICGHEVNIFESFSQTEAIAGYRFWHDVFPDTYRKNAPMKNYIGVPDPSLASVLMDEKGNIITEPGIAGEAVYRSPIMFSGYYKNEEATKKALEHGWFHSGDSVMYDENGLGIMVDRYKDVIKSGGESVSSTRVEAALRTHDAVKEVAVIGLPHAKWGEMVTGVVVLKEAISVSEENLIQFVREKLAGFETPKQIIFTETLPKTIADKVLKYKLREKYTP